MSIATVVLRGYGTGSYADVNKLPTLGYSIGAATTTRPDVVFTLPARNNNVTLPARNNNFTLVQR